MVFLTRKASKSFILSLSFYSLRSRSIYFMGVLMLLERERVLFDVHILVLGDKVRVGYHLCLRHIIDTLSKLHQTFQKKMRFYIYLL